MPEVVAANPGHRAARMFLAHALLSNDQAAAAVHELLDLLLTDPGPPERYPGSLRWYADDLVGRAEPSLDRSDRRAECPAGREILDPRL